MEERIKVVTEEMKVNDALFYKMQNEREAYLDKVSLSDSENIVDKAYEITIREFIYACMERYDLSYEAAQGLLRLDYPLAYLFASFSKPTPQRESLRDLMERCGRLLYTGIKAKA